jgi:hypothetical protein
VVASPLLSSPLLLLPSSLPSAAPVWASSSESVELASPAPAAPLPSEELALLLREGEKDLPVS